MKKTISLLLAFALCLSLCACGQSKAVKNVQTLIAEIGEVTLDSAAAISAAEEAYAALTEEEKAAVNNYPLLVAAKEAQVYLEAGALLEAGEYEAALELLRSIESYKKVAEQIAYAEALKEEQERLAREAEYAARPRQQVEITPENLETYFEFVYVPYFDSFDQLDTIVCKLLPRDEYLERIDFGSDFKIEILYKAEGVTATVEYDKDTNTYAYGPALPGWGGTMMMEEILTLTNSDLALLAAHKPEDISNPAIQNMGNIWQDTIFHENGMNGCNQWSYSIQQVQGTLVLFAD